MAQSLDREHVMAFVQDLAALCGRHGIQAVYGRDSILLRPLDREGCAGYAARFGYAAGWRLELVTREAGEAPGVMPREFGAFD